MFEFIVLFEFCCFNYRLIGLFNYQVKGFYEEENINEFFSERYSEIVFYKCSFKI